METLKIVGLCLSSFSLGISLTGLIFTTLNYREADRKLKQTAKKRLLSIDPSEPLRKFPGESSKHFVNRVMEALNEGELTVNAARASLGLPPIEKEERNDRN